MESMPLKSTTAGYLMLTLLQDCEFQVEMRCAFVNWVTMSDARGACKNLTVSNILNHMLMGISTQPDFLNSSLLVSF